MRKIDWTVAVFLVASVLIGCVDDPTERESAPEMGVGSRGGRVARKIFRRSGCCR